MGTWTGYILDPPVLRELPYNLDDCFYNRCLWKVCLAVVYETLQKTQK